MNILVQIKGEIYLIVFNWLIKDIGYNFSTISLCDATFNLKKSFSNSINNKCEMCDNKEILSL